MSVIAPNETQRSWRHHSRAPSLQLHVSDSSAAMLVGTRLAGFAVSVNPMAVDEPINPETLAGAAVAVIQLVADDPSTLARFQALASKTQVPLIATCYDPPLALVRSLIRSGAHDVIPLPLDAADLEASVAPISARLEAHRADASAANGKVVSVIKSVGGVGATALLSQLAVRFAEGITATDGQCCLMDLDIQFGDVAFQLGLKPTLTLLDLVEAGSRLDPELLTATTTEHRSGLQVIAAPPEIMQLESISSDQMLDIVDLAARQFGTVFVDLPTNWTNWSLSLLARSDLVLLITELSVPSLNRTRRQLELIKAQDLADLPIRVVANRYEKSVWRTLRQADVREALGRDVAYTIANDAELMGAAVDRGIPLSEVKRKSALGRDIDALADGIGAALGGGHN